MVFIAGQWEEIETGQTVSMHKEMHIQTKSQTISFEWPEFLRTQGQMADGWIFFFSTCRSWLHTAAPIRPQTCVHTIRTCIYYVDAYNDRLGKK